MLFQLLLHKAFMSSIYFSLEVVRMPRLDLIIHTNLPKFKVLLHT